MERKQQYEKKLDLTLKIYLRLHQLNVKKKNKTETRNEYLLRSKLNIINGAFVRIRVNSRCYFEQGNMVRYAMCFTSRPSVKYRMQSVNQH
jgi:hypothetical protein